MSIKEKVTKKLYKEYLLEIPYEQIDKEINNKIQNLIPSVSIPGFRKGKAPVNIVKKKYEDSILNEVLQNVINLKTSELIKEKKFNLFRQPRVDLKKFEKNQTAEIEIKIDLEPEIKLKDFKDIKLTKYEINLSKKNVDDNFKKFVNSQKIFKKIQVNRLIKKNDKVTININTQNKNIPEYLKNQTNMSVDTGLKQEIIPGINKELISKFKIGDKKKINLDLSKILKDEKLNKVEFDIEIVSIEESVKFEINEEYLKKNGFKNEQDLKNVLKNNALNQYNQGIKQIEKKLVMDVLDKQYNFDLPEGILEEDFKEIWNRIEIAKKDNNLDEDDKSLSDKDLEKRYKKISQRRVKLGVLMQSIAKNQKIEINDDELSRGILQYASQYPGQEKQIMDYIKKNPTSLESIKGPLLEQKIIDKITEKSSKTVKKIDEEQYKKLEEETFDIKR